jgi:hypothetical protein
MAYFRIDEPNQPTKWIKNIDRVNGILTFQNKTLGAFSESCGFYADSELDYLKFHFKEKYPELEYLTVDTSGY